MAKSGFKGLTPEQKRKVAAQVERERKAKMKADEEAKTKRKYEQAYNVAYTSEMKRLATEQGTKDAKAGRKPHPKP